MTTQVLLVLFCTLISSAWAEIVDCKMNWVSPSQQGFYYELYPLPLNGRPSGYDGQSMQQIINWQSFNESPLFKGVETDMNFDVVGNYGPNDTANGQIYGNNITVSNFTMMGRGWIIVPTNGIYTFSISADFAAGIRITNYTSNYCPNPYDASANMQFSISSYPTWPQNQTTTQSVYLDAGFPYMIQLAYIHVNGSPKLDISMTDPDGVYYDGIGDFVEEFDLYNPYDLVTNAYVRFIDNITVGYSGNSTTLLSLSSTGTIYDWTNITVTTFYIYGTPTPYVSTTPISSVMSSSSVATSMVSDSAANSSSTLSEYTGSQSLNASTCTSTSNSVLSVSNVTSSAINGTALISSSEQPSTSSALSSSIAVVTSSAFVVQPRSGGLSESSSAVTSSEAAAPAVSSSVEVSSSVVSSLAASVSSAGLYSNQSSSGVSSVPFVGSFQGMSLAYSQSQSHPVTASVESVGSVSSASASPVTPVTSAASSSDNGLQGIAAGSKSAPAVAQGASVQQSVQQSVLAVTTVVTETINGVVEVIPTTVFTTVIAGSEEALAGEPRNGQAGAGAAATGAVTGAGAISGTGATAGAVAGNAAGAVAGTAAAGVAGTAAAAGSYSVESGAYKPGEPGLQGQTVAGGQPTAVAYQLGSSGANSGTRPTVLPEANYANTLPLGLSSAVLPIALFAMIFW